MDKISCFLKGLMTVQGVVTDNRIFRLHYNVTVPLLVIFSIVVLCRQYFGNSVICSAKEDIPSEMLNNYCWGHTTYSNEDALNKMIGVDVPYPGIGGSSSSANKIQHTYYQWIGVILLVQAVLFYIPRYIWKGVESRTMNRLVLDLNCTICDQEKREANRKILLDYFINSTNKHVFYSISYFVCENLNVINIIGQICFIETLFGNRFSSFGANVIRFTKFDWSYGYNPMFQVFPLMAKCSFFKFGVLGNVQRHDATCVLPDNSLIEKIYVVLWFWFIILAVLSCMAVVYRVVLYLSSRVRAKLLIWKDTLVREEEIHIVLSVCNVGDWFVLDVLCKNLNPVNFRDLIHDLVVRIEGKHFSGL